MSHNTGVCEKAPLRRIRPLGRRAFGAPDQGLECSFCRWTAGQGLAQKEYLFTDTGKILEIKGFDSSMRGEISMSIGISPEALSQQNLAGIILAGRLGARRNFLRRSVSFTDTGISTG